MSAFCKTCDNILDISRNQPDIYIADDITPTDVSSNSSVNYDDIIEKIEKDEQISEQELSKIDFILLQKTQTYKDKNPKIKTKIRKRLDELIDKKNTSDSNVNAYYVCNNCSYNEPIQRNQLIASRLSDATTSKDNEYELKYRNKIFSSIIPSTREYKCPNEKCDTHTGKAPLEAKFCRTKGTTNLWYICVACTTAWRVS